jgi:capsular exopolysaccharide synthesis family protein
MTADTDVTNDVSSTDAIRAATRFLHSLRYRKKWLYLVFGVVFAAGAFYYLTAPRIYEATAQLLIDESQLHSKNMLADGMVQRAKLPTYERLITSDKVLKAAFTSLQEESPEVLLEFSGSADAWASAVRKSTTARAARNTNIIELSYRAKSTANAEIVLSAIMEAFLEFVRKLHQDNSIAALEVLNAERRDIEKQITENQERLVDLRVKVGAVGYDERLGDSHPDVQNALKLNETLTEARKKRVELQAKLASIQAAIRSGKDLREHLYVIDPSAGQSLISNSLGISAINAQRVSEEEQKLFEEISKLQAVIKHLGPYHPQRIELETGIEARKTFLAQYQQQINQRLTSLQAQQLGPLLLDMVGEKLSTAHAHELALLQEYQIAEKKVIAMNGGLAELMLVQRNLDRFNRSYDTLVEKIQGIDLGHNQGDVRVSSVGGPRAGAWPVSPRLRIIGATSVFLSILLGCGLVYFLDTLDDRFRTPDDLEQQARAPVLAVVRKLDQFEGTGVMALQVYREPRASNTEAFRTLRTALTIADPDRQCIAISSAEPGDGKTTISSNLAAAIAQSGRRILMIDADLRKPGMTKLFDLKQAPGLTTLLREENLVTSIPQYLIKTEIENLQLLPCGPKPIDPAEILVSREFSDLLSWATQNFDQVLVDCPPMLVANDAAIVSRLTEGLVLVVQPQKNSRRLVLRAADRVRSVGSNLLGLVVNFASEGREETYYGYSDQYGYGYGYGYGADSDHPAEVDAANSNENENVHSPTSLEAPAINRREAVASKQPTLRRRAA